jgi:RNase P subunit RPR2
MIAELIRNYHGVLCNRCREPIPVSAKTARLQDEPELADPQVARAFTLRCRACDEESIYAARDIRTFDGEPRARTSRARAAGA